MIYPIISYRVFGSFIIIFYYFLSDYLSREMTEEDIVVRVIKLDIYVQVQHK